MLPATWQGAVSATAASPSQCRRWGRLPQTGSQPTTGRLSLLTPLENYQSLKDTTPSLWQWIGYPSTSMPCPPLPQLTPQELHAFSLSMSGGTMDFWRLSSVAFISNFSRELAALLDIQLTPSTAYHPDRWTDGVSKPGD